MKVCVVNFIVLFLLAKFETSCHGVSLAGLKSRPATTPGSTIVKNKIVPKSSKLTTSNSKKSEIDHIKSVFKKYRQSSSIKMKVKKLVHMDLLDQDKESSGLLFYSK